MNSIKNLFLLLVILISNNAFSQDSNNVYYSLFMEKSVTFGTVDTKIDEGEFKEGESFIIPIADLPSSPFDFSIYQDLYNALVGGKFGIDYGAINNDIIMKIFIRNLNPNVGEYLTLGETGDTLFSYFEIRIWELPDSNFYPEETSFYFNDGHFATFALPKSDALNNFLTFVGIGTSDSLAFAYLEENENKQRWNAFGIETIETSDTIKFKAIHLSRIGGGRRRIASSTFPIDTTTSVGENKITLIPNKILLNQNYPNPFNPSTVLSYQLSEDGFVELDVYNTLGQHVAGLVSDYQIAGNYSVKFNTNNYSELTSGIYIYTIKQNGLSMSNKMLLIK